MSDGELRVEVLGPLRIFRDGRRLTIRSLKQRMLLGLLALRYDDRVPGDDLVDVLWESSPPPSSRNLLQTYVARLRRALGSDVIVMEPGGYRLTDSQVDLVIFDGLVEQARAAVRPEMSLELYAQAVRSWRGPALADLAGAMRRYPAIAAADSRRMAAVLAYADLAMDLGRHHLAVEQLQLLAYDEPLHEGLHARLMRALAGSGQRAAALTLYVRLRDRLKDEFGIEPGPMLQEAHSDLLRDGPSRRNTIDD